jgi:hypothetical protein
VIALLDRLPGMPESDLIGWDPVLMSILSACVIQQRLRLDSSGDDHVVTPRTAEPVAELQSNSRLSGRPNPVHNGALQSPKQL